MVRSAKSVLAGIIEINRVIIFYLKYQPPEIPDSVLQTNFSSVAIMNKKRARLTVPLRV